MKGINVTPKRTSNNFRINDYSINDYNIPKKIDKFENINISNSSIISYNKNKLKNIENFISNELLDNLFNNCNSYIEINNTKKETITIEYIFDSSNINLVNVININAKEELNLIIYYKSNTDKECFHNGHINIIGKNLVNITIVNDMNNSSYNFDTFNIKSSFVKLNIIDLGSKYSISNLYGNLNNSGEVLDVNTIYLSLNNQNKDINYLTNIKGDNCKCNMKIEGAIKNNSNKNLKATVDFKKGSKKSIGKIEDFCTMLTDDCSCISLPMLLCSEEDVEGFHSSASGNVDEDELFYLMSRAIDRKSATNLIVKSRLGKVINDLDTSLKTDILNLIERKLENEL